MVLGEKDLKISFFMYTVLMLITQLSFKLSLTSIDGANALLISIIWMVLTIPMYFIFNKGNKLRYVYSILNSLIAGVAISSLYSYKSIEAYSIVGTIVIFSIAMYVNYRVMKMTKKQRLISHINIIISVLGIMISIYIWMVFNPMVGSCLTFSIIIYMCFNISIYMTKKQEESYIKVVSKGSLIMFGGVFLAVLTAITDGDGLDLLDASWWSDTRKKKSK